MADNLTQVLSNYIIYVDSSSLMHGNMEFFKISLFNVLKSTNRKIKMVDFVVKDLKKKQFSDSEKFAVKALNIVNFYRKHGLVEDVVTSGIEQGKILDVIYNNRDVDKDDVCVITDNVDLANEIVTNLSARKGIDFDYKIAAVRLINGPALWNIKTVKPRVQPISRREEPISRREEPSQSRVSFDAIKAPSFSDNDNLEFDSIEIDEVKIDDIPEIKPVAQEREYRTPSYTRQETPQRGTPDYNKDRYNPIHETPDYNHKEEPQPRKQEPVHVAPVQQVAPKEEFRPVNNTRQKRSRLVVSLIVDNSSSLNDERIAKMKHALNTFNKKLKQSNVASELDLAVYGFDGFSPRVIKGYDGELDINRYDNGGIQVLGKTIELAMDDLVDRQKLYTAHNIETHKPWLIIMTDGGAYGDITNQVNKLKKIVKTKKITYFPFCLSSMAMEESLDPLAKLKMFLKIREDKFDELFEFLYNTITQRINTPDDVHMTLDRKALQGFIAR